MTKKLRNLTTDRVATRYLQQLCKIARDFRIGEGSSYMLGHVHRDDLWIACLELQSQKALPWRAEWHKFRIGTALAFFDKELPWIVNVKLGLADSLVEICQRIMDHDIQAANLFHLKMSLAHQNDCYMRMSKPFQKTDLWKNEVHGEAIVYDHLLARLITVHRDTEAELKELLREVFRQAYVERAIAELAKARAQDDYLFEQVNLRRMLQPVRRLNPNSFAYNIMQIEQEANRRIETVNRGISAEDELYFQALCSQEKPHYTKTN